MKFNLLSYLILFFVFASCKNLSQSKANDAGTVTFQNKGHELVFKMVQKIGNYNTLASKRNVSYTYTYQTPDGKQDVSNERYIFENELSYGKYLRHDRTFPQFEGIIEQGFDGDKYWLKHEGNNLTDESLLKRVAFNRPTNYYWFTMMQKLLDPGLNYEYLGETNIDNQAYAIVKVSFKSKNDKPTDIYQLYINKETSLVDQFLFTVADFGVMDTPNLMQLKYEEVDGLLIPTKRQYKKSNWNAKVSDAAWIYVTWSDIKFNTEITAKDFVNIKK